MTSVYVCVLAYPRAMSLAELKIAEATAGLLFCTPAQLPSIVGLPRQAFNVEGLLPIAFSKSSFGGS